MGINTCNRIWELMEKGDVDATASDVGATAGDFYHMKALHFGAGLLAIQAPLETPFRRHWKRRSGSVLVVRAALRHRFGVVLQFGMPFRRWKKTAPVGCVFQTPVWRRSPTILTSFWRH